LVISALIVAAFFTVWTIQRTRQIGLLKALGATDRDVAALFLAEAAILGLAGGALGVGIGLGIIQILRLVMPALPVETPILYVFAALALSFTVGILSGVLPARRAASLDPIEALRAE
ncbi:MAG TPA: FtsX-like permease family protein, partial [Candidatus Polarisedimenticolia bacterium]|nr:FtsX-like permease family protein [Candidatus Polarisedimenticolia bacterium]